MNISDFRAGTLQKGYRYKYFLPEKINHSFFWTDEGINELLERAFLAEEAGNNAMIATTSPLITLSSGNRESQFFMNPGGR
jgi:hypothetical protein